ncbi:MAG: glycosyl hydrolase 53 family protein [Coprobacillus sp.]|nr:glycosyl hydrolase 53 family protein [Coprobacillus sp.]
MTNFKLKTLLLIPVAVLSLSACSGDSGEFHVEKVDRIANNSEFMMGVDLSSIIEVEEAGGVFYDLDGNEKDVFEILSENGINYVRVRLWNNPYDSEGNLFQGGGNDIETDLKIAKRAVESGMKVAIDFHYSDFWADPGKQIRPYEWASLSGTTLYETASNWTIDVLERFSDEGCPVSMVQLGNEINNGWVMGLYPPESYQFLATVSKAVREFNSDIKITIHLASDQSASKLISTYQDMIDAGVDFDIIGLSYYPYWHGSLSSFKKTLSQIESTFSKDIACMEYSYAFTLDEEGGSSNMSNIFNKSCEKSGKYKASVAGQANAIHDINEAIAELDHGVGTFYWEPAWLPLEGTSWAGTTSTQYQDENNLGTDGLETCTWANQALFDYSGHALESLTSFNLMRGL